MNINSYYSFSLYANSAIKTNYTNARLVSILDYNTALKFSNIVLLNKQIYPYLPTGTPADLTKYTYFLFRVGDKEFVLADVWIIDNTIQQTAGVTSNIKLLNVTNDQVTIIRDQLRLLGIAFEIS